MEFSLREPHGVPGLCPWNSSWPGYLKTRSGVQTATHVTARWLASCLEYADFRRVCLVSDTSERTTWHLARPQAGTTEVE